MDPAYEALKPGHANLTLELDGASTLFEGATIEWDVSHSKTVGVKFTAPWYLRRTIEVLVWSEEPAEIFFSSPEAATSQQVILNPSAGNPVARRIQLAVLDEGDGLSEVIRLTAKRAAGTARRIWFGIEGHRPDLQTRVRTEWVMQHKLAILAATWAVMFTLLFLAAWAIGFGALAPIAPMLALVPTVFSMLGAQWTEAFKVNRIALYVVQRLPRWMQPVWLGLGGAAAGLLVYVIVAFAVYAHYRWDLNNAMEGSTTLEELADLFCRYPEREEVRALLARKIHTGTTPKSRPRMYGVAAHRLKDRFEDECLSTRRITPLFYEVQPVRRDDARIFYASLWWNALDVNVPEFHKALDRIRRILRDPPASTRLARLTLVKYETKLRMNLNESIYCNGAAAGTADCNGRRAECAEWRSKLLGRLEGEWDQSETDSVAYLEARDVAGSSLLFQGCASPAAPKLAMEQWRQMTNAIPKERVVLDDLLVQLNFRKLVDGWIDTIPHHPSSEAWKAACPTTYGGACQLLQDAFIANKQQVFFGPVRATRQAEWERASIPFLDGTKFPEKVRELAGKDWKWPL